MNCEIEEENDESMIGDTKIRLGIIVDQQYSTRIDSFVIVKLS